VTTDGGAGHPLEQAFAQAFRLLRWLGLLAVAGVALSGVRIVAPDEVALRLRFGRLTGATPAQQVHPSGLLLSLPYLVDEVIRVPVRRIRELRIEALAAPSVIFPDRLDVTREGYALTGDSNVVQIRAVAKYQITDPVTWALRVAHPEAAIEAVLVTALTRTVAEMTVDGVLVESRRALAAAAASRAQQRLDRDGGWVRLVAVEFTGLAPPPQVARAFDEVQSAFVEMKTRVEEARRYREQELPAAEAEAGGLARAAEAYEAEQREKARGASSAFLALVDEYRRDPGVVRQRLYREAMDQVMAGVGGRILVDPRAGRGRVLIPGGLEQSESGDLR
jgi:membrane protease subunit HflK